METLKQGGKTWYVLHDFMKAYDVKAQKTVYNMVDDGRAIKKKILGRVRFAKS